MFLECLDTKQVNTMGQLTLSNLSTAEHIDRNLSCGTPQASNIPSSNSLWLSLITYGPSSSPSMISCTTFTHSASGIIASYAPAISKSYKNSRINKLFFDLTKTTYTLIKLSVSTPCDRGIISAIHFRNVIPFDIRNLVHGEVPRKRYRQVVTQRQNLSALIS